MNDDFVQVIDEDTLQRRVVELAADITSDFPDGDLVVVGILKGSLIFMKDLLNHMPLTSTPEFLSLTRFGRDGRVSIALDVSEPLEDRDVLLALEIVDTGLTLVTIRKLLLARGARSVRTVALLDKTTRRIVDVPVEYRGFDVGDEYLLGYGLDWKGLYRNLRSVWAVLDIKKLHDDPKAYLEDAYGPGSHRDPA